MAQYRNRSLERALALLEALRAARGSRSLTELAEATSLDRSTAFRLLAVLMERHYVHRDARSHGYSLGYEAFRLAQPDHVLRTVRRMAQAYLSQLASELGETVILAELHGPLFCCYAEGRGHNASPLGLRTGVFAHAHASAIGKMLLAHRPAREVASMLRCQSPQAMTGKTLSDPRLLRAELRTILDQGYALERDEYRDGVSGLAVPILPPAGGVRFAIGVNTPSGRLSAGLQQEWILQLRATASAVARHVVQA